MRQWGRKRTASPSRRCFPPFDPSAPSCAAPDRQPIIAFVQDNRREFIEGARFGVERAASDRGLRFETTFADNDPGAMIASIDELRARRVGGLVVSPVDPVILTPSLEAIIW